MPGQSRSCAVLTCDCADDDDEKDPETRNLMLIQFEKVLLMPVLMPAKLAIPSFLTRRSQVSHVKNKWKCVFRNGVLNLNGEEHVVATAAGAFTF